MEVKSKKIKIDDQEFYFRLNFRAIIEFEELSKKPISMLIEDSMKDNSFVLYCGIKSGMKYEKKEFDLSYDEFVDLVDDNIQDLMTNLSEDNNDKIKKNPPRTRKKGQ